MAVASSSDANEMLAKQKRVTCGFTAQRWACCEVLQHPPMARWTFAREDTEPLPGQILQPPLPEGPRVPLPSPEPCDARTPAQNRSMGISLFAFEGHDSAATERAPASDFQIAGFSSECLDSLAYTLCSVVMSRRMTASSNACCGNRRTDTASAGPCEHCTDRIRITLEPEPLSRIEPTEESSILLQVVHACSRRCSNGTSQSSAIVDPFWLGDCSAGIPEGPGSRA